MSLLIYFKNIISDWVIRLNYKYNECNVLFFRYSENKMLDKIVLITGASRGLGLEIVKQLCQRTKNETSKIIATCRSPENASELQKLSDNNNLIIEKLDVKDFSSYPKFVDAIRPIVQTEGISCLINNAGISPKSSKYDRVTTEQMAETFMTNTIAPLMFSREMLPFLKTAASRNTADGSLIVNMSSILGSIELNDPKSGIGSGGVYPYRASKSALNMITRSLSLDVSHMNVNVVAIHPGWVKTDMGGKNAPLTPEESISKVINVIQNYDSEQYNGCLIDYKGQKLPF